MVMTPDCNARGPGLRLFGVTEFGLRSLGSNTCQCKNSKNDILLCSLRSGGLGGSG